MNKINLIFLLLVIFQIKHFLADYPLQTRYMLGKFKPGWAYINPLLAHVSVHGAFTFWIAWAFTGSFWFANGLALFDMVCHFTMDRIKASPDLLGRFKPLTKETYFAATPQQLASNNYFWWSIGLDQSVHHLTHYVIIWAIISWP
jgi:hypothetical protein